MDPDPVIQDYRNTSPCLPTQVTTAASVAAARCHAHITDSLHRFIRRGDLSNTHTATGKSTVVDNP
jgi:hypothetical protein